MTNKTVKAPPPLRIRGPADLAEAVPYLLGFYPGHSLVLVGLRRTEVVVTARIDLDGLDPDAPAVLPTLASITASDVDRFVGVVYDDDVRVAPFDQLPYTRLFERVADAVASLDCVLDEAALVSRGRVYSCLCTDPGCCPPEGRPLGRSSGISAAASEAGLIALPDRASLAATLAADPAEQRARLYPVLAAAEDRAGRAAAGGADAWPVIRSEVRELFRAARLIDGARDGPDRTAGTGRTEAIEPTEPTDDELVRMAVALRRTEVRDAVWVGIDAGRIDGRPLWRLMARRLPVPYDAPPLFLFAWSTYRAGDGALAGIAAERALASDPCYSAADLLLAALSQAVNPHRLPRLRERPAARRHRTRGTAASA